MSHSKGASTQAHTHCHSQVNEERSKPEAGSLARTLHQKLVATVQTPDPASTHGLHPDPAQTKTSTNIPQQVLARPFSRGSLNQPSELQSLVFGL